MKRFEQREIREAVAFAAAGGQALHVWDPGERGARWPGAPLVFRRSRPWAHLFDQDKVRLVETVTALGVNVVVVSHEGTPRQHVDLCARPLERAIKLCE